MLEPGDCIVSLAPLESCCCFGFLYANCPMANRRTIELHWNRFYPYRALWGDVSFSLSVWEAAGKVVETKRRLIRFRERENHPESPNKTRCFDSDCQAFLSDFPDMSRKWLAANWRLFNRPVRSHVES